MSDNTRNSRAPFVLSKRSDFTGPNSPYPKDGEMMIDDTLDGGNHIGFARIISDVPPIQWEFICPSKDTSDKVAGFDEDGTIAAAQSATLGRELNYIFYDPTVGDNAGTFTINPNMVFPKLFKYFTISINGQFLSGLTDDNVNGEMSPYDVYNPEAGNKANPVSVRPGIEIKDGDPCTLTLLDADGKVVLREVYWIERVTTFGSLTINNIGVKSLSIIPNNPVAGEPNTIFAYCKSTINILDNRFFIEYTDGTTHDITHEAAPGGRLDLSELLAIDTSVITATGALPEVATITYSDMVDGSINPDRTVSIAIKVRIRADPEAVVSKFLPVYFVDNLYPDVVQEEHFVLYDSGSIVNVENNFKDGITPVVSYTTSSQAHSYSLELGALGNVDFNATRYVRFKNEDGNKLASVSLSSTFVDDYETITYESSPLNGNKFVFSGSPTTFENDVKEFNKNSDGIRPNSIRVRNLDGTVYYIGGHGVSISNELASTGAEIDVSTITLFNKYIPVIIEYLNVTTVDSKVEVVTTNFKAAYIKL